MTLTNLHANYICLEVQMKKSSPDKLRDILTELDITNEMAASYLGVSIRTMYRYLAGEVRIPAMVLIALKYYTDEL